MKPPSHAAVSFVIAAVSGLYFRSFKYAAVSFAAGLLIDLDHFLDYYLNHRITFNIEEVYNACLDLRMGKIYLLLHSYELIILFWLSIYIYALGSFWKALAIGFTQHLLLDQFSNPIVTPAYFLVYRLMHGFKKERLIRR